MAAFVCMFPARMVLTLTFLNLNNPLIVKQVSKYHFYDISIIPGKVFDINSSNYCLKSVYKAAFWSHSELI